MQNPPDQISSKLEALQAYQLSIAAPAPSAGTFDAAGAERGRAVFTGAGKCSSCHAGTLLTDANSRLHPPSEVVSEPEPNGAPSAAARSATKMYRTTPLRGLQHHAPYFHNGMAATLDRTSPSRESRASPRRSTARPSRSERTTTPMPPRYMMK